MISVALVKWKNAHNETKVIAQLLFMQVQGVDNIISACCLHPSSEILFSSVSSIVAPLGQPNYAAANAILNAHANKRSQQVESSFVAHWL